MEGGGEGREGDQVSGQHHEERPQMKDRHNIRKHDEEKLLARYKSEAERGIILSVPELKQYCKDSGLKCPTQKRLKELRKEFQTLALYSNWNMPKRPHFMGPAYPKLGCVQVDMAHFEPRLAAFNKQCKYFLVGQDSLSQLLTVIPLTNKTRRAWEKGLEVMRKQYPVISHFVSDRDTAITSKKFQDNMRKTHGIKWFYLPSRNKAFRAERMIQFVKKGSVRL